MNPNVTYFPKESVSESAGRFPTPFFLYKEKRIREKCRRLKNAFSKYFENFWPLYAVKANPNPDILRIILDEGFGLDVSSESEVWIANKLEAKGMFTGNYNPSQELKAAKGAGFILNIDDISQIPFLKEIGVPEILSFRINPGIGRAGIESNILAGPDAKYGVPFEKAADAYKQAKELGIKQFGIHMMTGSNVLDEDYFPAVVEKLFEVVANVKSKTGIEIEMMNIGGGFGVPYKPDEKCLDIEIVARSVREVFDKQIDKYNLKKPRLLVEPGRYITADAGWLIARVFVIKNSYKKFVGVDAGMNDLPRPAIYGAYHHVSILDKEDAQEKEIVNIVGRLCENNDQFAKDRELPKIEVGDIVIIHNAGGHAYSMGHNYNGRPRSAEYLITTDGNIKQIRRAETIEDLFRATNLEI